MTWIKAAACNSLFSGYYGCAHHYTQEYGCAMALRPHYDTIIIGAGSAGCVLANRFGKDPDHQVLLLEAGGRDWNPLMHIPAGLGWLVKLKSGNWGYETEPEPQLDNRRLYWPRGKVLGGSSSINAMCYCRGHRRDYDDWATAGNKGWDFDSVLPYFRKSENQEHGQSKYHGVGGPLSVCDLRHVNPLSDVFLEAAVQCGFQRTDDFNGPDQRGFAHYQVTQKNGRRCSTSIAYLNPVKNRGNLHLATGALVARVLLEGTRAVGVEVIIRRIRRKFHAGRVILCGGTINSPQLLMLSGIGPADHLRATGVGPHIDLPGVGRNLQDHLDICTLVRSKQPLTYDRVDRPLSLMRNGWKYLARRTGAFSSNLAESGGFVQSQYAQDDRPDIQLHFVPALLDDHGRNRLDGDGMTIHACNLQPRSRGQLLLKSADPGEAPALHANYLDNKYDVKMMLECARLGRRLFNAPAFAAHKGDEYFPGEQVQSESDLLAFIRRKAESIYHPVGTCKMGLDGMAVVDPGLAVHGTQGLYVVDASVMPSLISGNTNAPTVMIAERAADLLDS